MKGPSLPPELTHAKSFRAGRVRFSVGTLGLCWLVILSIHGVAIAYTAIITWFYRLLPYTYLQDTLVYIKLGLNLEHYPTIVNVHIASVIPHALAMTVMLVSSLYYRRPSFSILSSSLSTMSPVAIHTTTSWGRIRSFLVKQLVATDGVFGVDSAYFDLVLLIRELIETGFQTYQGYRMSYYLPRLGLNRVFVGLLVVNCWSTALVQYVFRHDSAKRRLICLLCDALLDLVCSVGIPILVFRSYWTYYDPTITGFPEDLWHDDIFLINVKTELQMFVVSSWIDLISRVAFMLGLYSALDSIKDLLCTPTPSGATIQPTPLVPGSPTPSTSKTPRATKNLRSIETLHGVLFGVWGAVVLLLHVYAESAALVPECALQVRPWAVGQPGCSLLVTNCHAQQLRGSSDEMTTAWSKVEPRVLLRLVVRHCPELEIAPQIQQFHSLTGLKIYNSTVIQWDATAELNADSHPALMFLQLARVNLPNGTIPRGLRAPAFPPNLLVLEICSTNIASLPDDLDQIWHKGSTLYVEDSALTEFPSVMTRLDLKHCSVSGNPITSIPPEAFASPNLVYIGVSSTLIQELPPDVGPLSPTIRGIFVTHVNLTYWYDWVDPLIHTAITSPLPYYPLYVHGTPYCEEHDAVLAGNRTTFSVTTSPSPKALLSQTLMNTTDLESYFFKYGVYCGYYPPVMFPLALEDSYYALSS